MKAYMHHQSNIYSTVLKSALHLLNIITAADNVTTVQQMRKLQRLLLLRSNLQYKISAITNVLVTAFNRVCVCVCICVNIAQGWSTHIYSSLNR